MSVAPVILTAGDVEVEIALDAGARVGQIRVEGVPLLVDGDDVDGGADPTSTGWGSFPMAPWAGRIRHGTFSSGDDRHRLDTNHLDASGHAHAIHGTVFQRPWQLTSRDAGAATMNCPLTGELRWPFPGTATQAIELTTDTLTCRLTVEAHDVPFPAEIGWHPWFRTPDELDFHPTAMYRRDDIGVTTAELVDPTPGPWDDCFVNTAPVTLRYDRRTARTVTVTSDCDHWVLYDEPRHATCVEPQSGPPDAANIRPRVTSPGTPLARWMAIAWA